MMNEPTETRGAKEAFPAIPFDTRAQFEAQLLLALGSAQREIWLADEDFSRWPLNQMEAEQAMHAFLLASRSNRIHVLTAKSAYLMHQAPRFMRLVRLFGHALAWRSVPDPIITRFAEDCSFCVVDRARMVRRYHRDTMRGVAEFHPNEVGPWVDQFQSVWDEASPGIAAVPLGLGG
jgi:hypothetical protein